MIFTVDIDNNNIYNMLKSVKKALDLGLKVIRVEVSPSGKGFHIVLEKENISEFDCLLYRAMLGDDAYRLRYSLIKFALNHETDVCFERKAKKNSREIEIDIEELKKIDVLEVENLVEKYEKKIGNLIKKIYLTVFEIQDGKKEEVKKVMEDIAEKDRSFKFRIYSNLMKNGKTEYLGIIFSPSKDKAHKRGVWFVNNVDGVESYWVKTKETKN